MIPSEADATGAGRRDWPRGLVVLHAALRAALAAEGEMFQPEPGVLPVRAVSLWAVRDRFYRTYAEPEEDQNKRQTRMRKAWHRAVADAQAKNVIRVSQADNRPAMVWQRERGEQ